MHPNRLMALRTLLAHPDRPDLTALFAVLNNEQVSEALACLAPPGSLAQIAAALKRGWSWCCDGWERQIDALVAMITDPRCPSPNWMIATWSRIPGAIGTWRDQTDDLVAWAQQRLDKAWYADLATLLGPSDAAARLLMRYPYPSTIGTILRRWSMAISPDDPTAWQAMIDPDMRAALYQRADRSLAFPAWGWDDVVDPVGFLTGVNDDLTDGWSLDHLSIRGRFAWVERNVDADVDVGYLSFPASIGRSDALAETVCTSLGHAPSSIVRIANNIPWDRLHPRIQTVIDTTMRQESDRWKRTWACAIGMAPVKRNTTIDANLLMWRIAPERWNDLDPSIRAALVSRISDLPDHCFAWGVHPDLVARWGRPKGKPFRFWNPDVPADDLRAWAYADLLREQRDRQDAWGLIVLLDDLPPDRRARFEAIIDWRLVGRSKPSVQPPWEWAGWAALPAADRQTALETWLSVLWGDRDTFPAVRFWRARNDGLATVAIRGSDVLGIADPTPILAALLAQVLGLQEDTTDARSSLPFPDDLDAARRAQIERLPLAPDAQVYAAWCLRFFDQDMVLGSTLIALHPDVAVALAPFLNADQQKAVAASPAAQGWDSMTVMHWAAVCAPAQEQPMPPIQRRIL